MYLLQFQTGLFFGGLLLPLLAYLFAVPIIVPCERGHPREPLNDAGDDGEGENDDVLVRRGVALFCVCVLCCDQGCSFFVVFCGPRLLFYSTNSKAKSVFYHHLFLPFLSNQPPRGGEGVVCCCVWEEAWARAMICMPFPNVSADFSKTCFFALTSTQLHVCVVYFGG